MTTDKLATLWFLLLLFIFPLLLLWLSELAGARSYLTCSLRRVCQSYQCPHLFVFVLVSVIHGFSASVNPAGRFSTTQTNVSLFLVLFSQCKRHVDTMRRCPTRAAFRANQICGCILSPHSETGRCMRTRTKSRDRTLTYYACVQQYCSYGGSEQDGCDIIQQMLRKNACPLPRRFFC